MQRIDMRSTVAVGYAMKKGKKMDTKIDHKEPWTTLDYWVFPCLDGVLSVFPLKINSVRLRSQRNTSMANLLRLLAEA